MNKRGIDGGGSDEVDGISETTENANMVVARASAGGDLLRERESEVED